MEELISVIVSVFNVEDYLPNCLKSLEAQSYKNLEIIFVDDGSTDKTGQLCDAFAAKDPRARVIHHSKNVGLWAGRNTGQDAATGEYLWFVDGDDYFHKDILKLMYEAINQLDARGNKYDVAIVNHKRATSFEEDIFNNIERVEMVPYASQEELMYDVFKSSNLFTSVWNKLFRRKLVEDIRNEKYARSQDWDYCFRAFLKATNGIRIDNTLYYWVNREGSSVNSMDFLQILAECKTLMFYRNYVGLPADKKKYGHYLLDGIYRLIIDFEEKLWDSNARKDVEIQFNEIINDTWWDYLRCHEIPFNKKISRLIKAKFPSFSHWILTRHKDHELLEE